MGRSLASKVNQRGSGQVGLVVFGLAALCVIGLCFAAVYKSSERDVTTKVESKERVCSSTDNGSDCKYLVFTEAGTFKLEDTLLYARFNTSDVYGKLKEGETYKMRVVGWRFGFFSLYPNILKVQDVAVPQA